MSYDAELPLWKKTDNFIDAMNDKVTTKNLKFCDSPSDRQLLFNLMIELCLKELMHICRKELIRNLLLMCFHHRGGVF